jgi:hypothetical protein
MASRKKKKPATQKLDISMIRRGVLQYETAYTAPEAARIATKFAKQGWTVDVIRWGGRSAHYGDTSNLRRNVKMTCKPVEKRGKVYAACTMKPDFKKAVLLR